MKSVLRSQQWFEGHTDTALAHRDAMRSAGFDMNNYSGQPIIGIANTWGEVNSCNLSLKDIAAEVKKGIFAAGGIPLEFPVISLGEDLMKPSAMLYRNLLSMDVEENLRSYPIDGVILLGNCDKTVPGLLMGAVSANLPLIQLNAGPKKVGVFKGQRLGSGTDLWRYADELKKNLISNEEFENIGIALSCGAGACNTMGTASTMNGMLEALGVMPLGLSTLPVDSEKRFELSRMAGQRIVEMVREDLRPAKILTPDAFWNAAALLMAIGGSTNALIHLTAIAGRLAIPVYPQLFDEVSALIPCIGNVQPAGKYLVDDFDAAGGIPSVLYTIKKWLKPSAITYTGGTLVGLIASNRSAGDDVIRAVEDPVSAAPTLALLRGNLAPDGAVIKVASASASLFNHCGPALVFDSYQDMLSNIDRPDLDVNRDTVLVLRNAGPKGVPGMPEWGMIPVPKKLQLEGVTDMLRISDSRMSGTSYGTVILHVSPEAADGGPLSIVRNGDTIALDLGKRSIDVLIGEEEWLRRKQNAKPFTGLHKRGYPFLYVREVLQASEGCDFAFLKPKNEDELPFIEPTVGRS